MPLINATKLARKPNLIAPPASVIPSKVVGYFDVLTAWFTRSLSKATQQKIKDHCDGKCKIDDKPLRYLPEYRQRIEMRQPRRVAFETLANCSGRIMLNHAEIAADMIYLDALSREAGFTYVFMHIVKKYRRSKHQLRVLVLPDGRKTAYSADPDTRWRYDDLDQPRAILADVDDVRPILADNFAIYGDRPSKAASDGDFCGHFEWRIHTSQSMKRNGLRTPSDLLELDFHEFFKHRLLLAEFDETRLGRALVNSMQKARSKRRSPITDIIAGRAVDRDQRFGRIFLRAASARMMPRREWRPDEDPRPREPLTESCPNATMWGLDGLRDRNRTHPARRINPASVLIQVDATPFLPPKIRPLLIL